MTVNRSDRCDVTGRASILHLVRVARRRSGDAGVSTTRTAMQTERVCVCVCARARPCVCLCVCAHNTRQAQRGCVRVWKEWRGTDGRRRDARSVVVVTVRIDAFQRAPVHVARLSRRELRRRGRGWHQHGRGEGEGGGREGGRRGGGRQRCQTVTTRCGVWLQRQLRNR